MNIAMAYGFFSSSSHGPFTPSNLYGTRALTGSESSFFNAAIGLAELGHAVTVFCDCKGEATVSNVWFMPLRALEGLPFMRNTQVVIAWNEPDLLAFAPSGALKVVDQQLNDWPYCRHPKWQEMPDLYVFPSISSMNNHRSQPVLMDRIKGRMDVIPNSCNLEHFSRGHVQRNSNRVIWASSPDRGLHHLLEMWMHVRGLRPDAHLKIFYRIYEWLDRMKDEPSELGMRARSVAANLAALRHSGVEVCGPVDNLRMAVEYQSAAVLAYPCDPVSYTEGFGCTVLDACAGGCQPVISNADALPEAHGAAAVVMDTFDRYLWASAIVDEMGTIGARSAEMRAHANAHSRARVAAQWERTLWTLQR